MGFVAAEPDKLQACLSFAETASDALLDVPLVCPGNSSLEWIWTYHPRVWMPKQAYERLHLQVLRRDDWRCQNCGQRQNLEIHHKERRSQGGHDTKDNLITLCSAYHAIEHSR